MLKDENGEPAPVYSVASGLDYPSSGPEHAFLHDLGRVKKMKRGSILVCLSGRGDKDMEYVIEKYGIRDIK